MTWSRWISFPCPVANDIDCGRTVAPQVPLLIWIISNTIISFPSKPQEVDCISYKRQQTLRYFGAPNLLDQNLIMQPVQKTLGDVFYMIIDSFWYVPCSNCTTSVVWIHPQAFLLVLRASERQNTAQWWYKPTFSFPIISYAPTHSQLLKGATHAPRTWRLVCNKKQICIWWCTFRIMESTALWEFVENFSDRRVPAI